MAYSHCIEAAQKRNQMKRERNIEYGESIVGYVCEKGIWTMWQKHGYTALTGNF